MSDHQDQSSFLDQNSPTTRFVVTRTSIPKIRKYPPPEQTSFSLIEGK